MGDIGNRIGLGNNNGAQITIKTTELPTLKPQQQQPTNTKPSPAELSANKSNSLLTSDESSVEEELIDDGDIIDIDSGDADNPQLFSSYVREIYSYLIELERKQRISTSFLQGKTVTTKMRAILVDWLMQVHAKFRLLQETMYLCVYILDAYLERRDVAKSQLQLVGVTSLLVACKYEEMYVPAIEDFVYMTDSTYTAAEIRAMEVCLCKTLNFAFGKPLPLHFLRRFSKAAQVWTFFVINKWNLMN